MFLFHREIDDIVLAYVVNILEDVASSTRDEEGDAFDVTEFCEMLTAYLPLTESIPAELVTEWMFQLAAEQRELDRAKGSVTNMLNILIDKPGLDSGSRRPKELSKICGAKKNNLKVYCRHFVLRRPPFPHF